MMAASSVQCATSDGRRGNAMSKERKALDAMLARWGVCWMTAFASLGYPRQAVFTRVGELGTRVSNEFAGALTLPDELARLDKAVCALRPIRRKVVIARYVYFVSVEHAARDCGMSVRRFRYILTSACDMLEDLVADILTRAARDI